MDIPAISSVQAPASPAHPPQCTHLHHPFYGLASMHSHPPPWPVPRSTPYALSTALLAADLPASQAVLVVKNPPANAGDAGTKGSIPGWGRVPGAGNGNPLQYSGLENPMDRGAWWATHHGVAKGQTRLSTHTPSLLLSLTLKTPPAHSF